MHRKMLGGGDDFQVMRIVALHALDESHCHAGGKERVLAVSLLAAAPARIAKDVDVGRPEGEAAVALMILVAESLVVLGARFGGNSIGDAVHQGGVPGGGQADGLREYGGLSGARHAVEGFIPPAVGRDAEARDGGRLVLHLQDFLLERHAGDQVGRALLSGQAGIEIGWLVCRLTEQGDGQAGEDESPHPHRLSHGGGRDGAVGGGDAGCVALATELGQSKPIGSVEEEAMLNLARTHEFVQQRMAEFFKQFQLTATQYNILRILRGAGKDGISYSEAAGRMVTADSDITRLLDRLEVRNLIARERSRQDRRVAMSRITAGGLDVLKTIDKPLAGFMKTLAGHAGQDRLRQLIEILESIRRD